MGRSKYLLHITQKRSRSRATFCWFVLVSLQVVCYFSTAHAIWFCGERRKMLNLTSYTRICTVSTFKAWIASSYMRRCWA